MISTQSLFIKAVELYKRLLNFECRDVYFCKISYQDHDFISDTDMYENEIYDCFVLLKS